MGKLMFLDRWNLSCLLKAIACSPTCNEEYDEHEVGRRQEACGKVA